MEILHQMECVYSYLWLLHNGAQESK